MKPHRHAPETVAAAALAAHGLVAHATSPFVEWNAELESAANGDDLEARIRGVLERRPSAVGIGGSTLPMGNVELTFPLRGTGYDRTLRVLSFLDTGNVWGEGGNSIGASGLRYGYGVGGAWISPIEPLRLSQGFPLTKHDGDQYQKFQFQIGTAF